MRKAALDAEMPDKSFVERVFVMLMRAAVNVCGMLFTVPWNVGRHLVRWTMASAAITIEEFERAMTNLMDALNSRFLRLVREYIGRFMMWLWLWIVTPLRYAIRVLMHVMTFGGLVALILALVYVAIRALM